jgi:hypothetical protein
MSLVVRKPGPAKLSARDISRAMNLPLAGTLRSEPTIPRGLEDGVAPAASGHGSLAALCTRLMGSFGLDDRSGSQRPPAERGSQSAVRPPAERGSQSAVRP